MSPLGGPPCPAPPCLELFDFVDLVRTDEAVVSLASIHNEKSLAAGYFYAWSHFVASDAAGRPLHCAVATWTEPRTLAHVDDFLNRVRRAARLDRR